MSAAEALPPPDLRVRGLAVTRGERLLFAGLDFTLAAGAALLLRGPNGAGKSSLLLALAGIIRPDAGEIRFGPAAASERGGVLHFLGHQSAVKPRLTLVENLDFWRAFYGGTGGAIPAAALEQTGLGGLGSLEAGHLSAGQTRRLALARLLVAPRPLWLLDEPTAALDAAGDGIVGGLISEHCRTGGLVVAATHQDLGIAPAVPQATLDLGAAP